jgi:hypothetical protein
VRHRPRVADPRIIASVAFILAAAAIALEIVYAIGQFVLATVEQFPS